MQPLTPCIWSRRVTLSRAAQEDLDDGLHHARAGRAAQGAARAHESAGRRVHPPGHRSRARQVSRSAPGPGGPAPARHANNRAVRCRFPPSGSATSRSSRTSITGRPRSPIASSRRAARSPRARRRSRCSTRWISSASAASRSRRSRSSSTTRPNDGQTYQFHLIDTPGHVDFHYEVSRSLAACEGALLVVDAAQGVEAQTLANVYVALDNDLDDRPGAQQDRSAGRAARLGQAADRGHDRPRRDGRAARVGEDRAVGVHEMLEAIVERIPPPNADREAPLSRADLRQLVRHVPRRRRARARDDGHDHARARSSGSGRPSQIYDCTMIAVRTPGAVRGRRRSRPGRSASSPPSIKDIAHARVGDTVTDADRPCDAPLPGFKTVKPMVFAGLFPGRRRRLPGPQGRARQARAERRER